MACVASLVLLTALLSLHDSWTSIIIYHLDPVTLPYQSHGNANISPVLIRQAGTKRTLSSYVHDVAVAYCKS